MYDNLYIWIRLEKVKTSYIDKKWIIKNNKNKSIYKKYLY